MHFSLAGLLSPDPGFFHLGELNPFSRPLPYPVTLGGEVRESLGPEQVGTQVTGQLSGPASVFPV